MFAGIGGFELGIQKGSENLSERSRKESGGPPREGPDADVERLREEQFRCVGYCEIDKYPLSVYRRHFPEHENFGDAAAIAVRDLPDFDFLVAGFPCQAFSIAGRREGFMDVRGTLFFEIARVLEHKRPRYFLLENVQDLLNHDKGKTIVTIITILADLGYEVAGRYLIARTTDYRNTESECSLLDILEPVVHQKYFLSERVLEKIKDRLLAQPLTPTIAKVLTTFLKEP